MKKERNSAMELLRIIAMFMIIVHHYVVHGSADYMNFTSFSFVNGLLLQWFSLGGKLGCLIFVCITGYYQIKSKLNFKRIILLLLQVQFFAIAAYIIDIVFLDGSLNIKDILRSLFPTIFNQYWFFTAYIVLYLLSPLLNKIVLSSDKKVTLAYIILCVFLWFVIPSFGGSEMFGNPLPLLCLMYVCGAYIRLYMQNKTSFFKGKALLILSCGLLLVSVLCFDLLGEVNPFFYEHSTHFANINSILLFMITVSCVIVFSNLTPFTNKMINIIASATFGVYLIHDNRFLGTFIWNDLFKNTIVVNEALFGVYALASCLIVYAVCTLIELVRKLTFEKWIDNSVSVVSMRIENLIQERIGRLL